MLHHFAKFQKCQLDNLVDFEKCCKTPINLQRSAPMQPKTSDILLKFYQKLATTLRVLLDPLHRLRRLPFARGRVTCLASRRSARGFHSDVEGVKREKYIIFHNISVFLFPPLPPPTRRNSGFEIIYILLLLLSLLLSFILYT